LSKSYPISPVPNVWSYVEDKVARMGGKTFQDLKTATDGAFQNLPKYTLVNLFQSVPKRMQLCVEQEGRRIGS
jgi:hypothetical protein